MPLKVVAFPKCCISMHASDRFLAEGTTLDDLRRNDGMLGYSPNLRHGVTGQGLNDSVCDVDLQRAESFATRHGVQVHIHGSTGALVGVETDRGAARRSSPACRQSPSYRSTTCGRYPTRRTASSSFRRKTGPASKRSTP